MSERIKLSETNQENMNRISQLLNVSVNALGNYIVSVGAKLFEENFKKLDEDLKTSFKKAIKKNNGVADKTQRTF